MLDRIEPDTRARIVATAERLFRDVGYQKTTVADIARALKMSPANVYRFFDSKKSINEAVAERLTGQVYEGMLAIARQPKPASARLRELLFSSYQKIRDLGVTEVKMHDMVEAAMTESWSVIRAHIEAVDQLYADVIADGIASGEFRSGLDAQRVAPCVRAAMMRFCHPGVASQCMDIPTPALDDQLDFIMMALLPAR